MSSSKSPGFTQLPPVVPGPSARARTSRPEANPKSLYPTIVLVLMVLSTAVAMFDLFLLSTLMGGG